ncbi:MAG: low molecular weight phosphotyrosine phosphatase family protein [Hyphomicrobiales bacterium]|nr:low molecular weight phosphotyrosine phosphatase family protein [Hyphomicrobiales bacterium]
MTDPTGTEKNYNVLFIGTTNSARSILAEAAMNQMGHGRFKAYSAGPETTGAVHPMALHVLSDLNLDTSFARSKSWREFDRPGAPHMHFIFSVCDNIPGDQLPEWPGHPLTATWGVPDPKHAEGNDAERGLAFSNTYKMLSRRVGLFLALPPESFERLAFQPEERTAAGMN